jgi:hypothetical protein
MLTPWILTYNSSDIKISKHQKLLAAKAKDQKHILIMKKATNPLNLRKPQTIILIKSIIIKR